MRWLWLVMLVVTGLVVADALRDGLPVTAAVFAVLGLAMTWWVFPWRGGGAASHAEIEQLPTRDRPVVIYWRPGCSYCLRLRGRLRRTGRRATWINIWQDPEAAAFVRGVNDGNETVPTVVMDDRTLTNPDPQLVLERLRA